MTQSKTPLSERIRVASQPAWDGMQEHPFVTAIEADRLSDAEFRAYLIYECDFVETAMLIFGHMLVKAPGLEERRWLAGVLQALAVEQIGYFETTFAKLGITTEVRAKAMPPSVLAFRDGMLKIAAEGNYLDGVAIMLAAEWMYATWCSRAAKCTISNPVLKRWVDLHAEPEFLAQADWLRRQIDSATPALEPQLAASFRHALELEIDFHTAPLERTA
ncbi:thiaminase (transcriptional activator TenA) [Kaistia soli DSM 19436]|uniref:Aminopyrimidine aminohydrolase n=1 Tax=Kaistia soli DSM 19436 TaxID=1122133 RepID=A0A1M5I5R6_9HYPH|nr:TenA family protein [Kaistia soli]SHG23537.1 thiaminase (transcriptional activator TenA) [Kaistia soli DSM 19436]